MLVCKLSRWTHTMKQLERTFLAPVYATAHELRGTSAAEIEVVSRLDPQLKCKERVYPSGSVHPVSVCREDSTTV
jgi:hypothetical protein